MELAVEKFKGSTILSVDGLSVDSNQILFKTDKGTFSMYHSQDCYESVEIDSISGAMTLDGALVYDLIEKTNTDGPKYEYDGSFTWTFYTLVTSKGYTDIRWYGTSNGYYSESVSFEEIEVEDV
jgi:hypothetical protein